MHHIWVALEWYIERVENQSGVPCSLTIDLRLSASEVGHELGTALFRIIQEALTNVVRHAHAKLTISTYVEEVYALRAIKLGAAGYLTENVSADTLVAAVGKVHSGDKFIAPSLAERFAQHFGAALRPAHEGLSDRELESIEVDRGGRKPRPFRDHAASESQYRHNISGANLPQNRHDPATWTRR